MYQRQMNELLQENGGLSRPTLEIKDGYAIDTSFTWPHLDRILEDSEEIIAERSGERLTADPYRSYFQDVWPPQDYEKRFSISSCRAMYWRGGEFRPPCRPEFVSGLPDASTTQPQFDQAAIPAHARVHWCLPHGLRRSYSDPQGLSDRAKDSGLRRMVLDNHMKPATLNALLNPAKVR